MSKIPTHALHAMNRHGDPDIQGALMQLTSDQRSAFLQDLAEWRLMKFIGKIQGEGREQTEVKVSEVKHSFTQEGYLGDGNIRDDKGKRLPAVTMRVQLVTKDKKLVQRLRERFGKSQAREHDALQSSRLAGRATRAERKRQRDAA